MGATRAADTKINNEFYFGRYAYEKYLRNLVCLLILAIRVLRSKGANNHGKLNIGRAWRVSL